MRPRQTRHVGISAGLALLPTNRARFNAGRGACDSPGKGWVSAVSGGWPRRSATTAAHRVSIGARLTTIGMWLRPRGCTWQFALTNYNNSDITIRLAPAKLWRMKRDGTENACLGLWAQVVLQAKTDLDEEPIGSLLYSDAASFFVGSGEWAESRTIVAECLNIPPNNLYRCGKKWIARRRAREAQPPEPLPAAPPVPVSSPLPLLVVLPVPDRRGCRRIRGLRANNPFNPFRGPAASP